MGPETAKVVSGSAGVLDVTEQSASSEVRVTVSPLAGVIAEESFQRDSSKTKASDPGATTTLPGLPATSSTASSRSFMGLRINTSFRNSLRVVEPPHAIARIARAELTFTQDEASKLGRGGFGMVYRGRWKDKDVAIKAIKIDDSHARLSQEAFWAEAEATFSFDHRHLIKCHGVCIDRDVFQPLFAIVMPVWKGSLDQWIAGDLSNGVKPSTQQRLQVLADVASALVYLHDEKERVHQDIKPPNVLINVDEFGRATACLSDLGLIKVMSNASTIGGPRGTDFYMDPAPGQDTTLRTRFTFASDVYSFSILAYEVLASKRAYPLEPGLSEQSLVQSIGRGHRPDITLLSDIITPQLRRVITAGWAVNQSDRPAIVEFHRALTHRSPNAIAQTVKENPKNTTTGGAAAILVLFLIIYGLLGGFAGS